MTAKETLPLTPRIAIVAASLCAMSASAAAENTLTITVSNDMEMTEASDGFRVDWAVEDGWKFSSRRFQISLQTFDFEGDGVARVEKFVEANSYITFHAEIDGARRRIACRGPLEDGPTGWIERTALSEATIAAHFEVTFDRCRDFHDSSPVAYDGAPLTVTGSFEVEVKSLF